MKKYSPDILYKGMTRHAMKFGMPYKYFVLAMVFYVLVISRTKSLIVIVLLPPILWLIGLELGRRDPRLIDIWIAKLQLPRLGQLYKRYWKARTYGRF